MMGKAKVLITPQASFGKFSQAKELLCKNDIEPVFPPYPHPLTENQLLEVIAPFDALIFGLEPLTERVFEKAKNLKVVSKHGVGVDNVDIEAATRRGIVVTNAPGSNENAVAELTIAFLFMLARHVVQLHEDLRKKQWGKMVGMELEGKILGVVGTGRIGKRVAKKAIALGMRVLGYDIVLDQKLGSYPQFQYTDLEQLLQTSDFVTLHLPLNEETRGLLNREKLALMKKTAFLINTARGGIVDEKALYEVLREGRIAGAALDVFSQEPPFDNPILELPNVITTPHIGADTREAVRNMDEVSAKNVILVLQGKPPLHSVNFHLLQKEDVHESSS
jgi:D-3-phosphoglycerate dehydrogenase